MAISTKLAKSHVQEWQRKLKKSHYKFTAKWPERIFRHDPLENIAEILNSGQLLSRKSGSDKAPIDAAAAPVVSTTDSAHDKVRMYFRPRTPTQYRIEGIRKPDELYYEAHAPTIGMMIFNAVPLLTTSGSAYSTCNMQATDAEVGDDDKFFSENMDFEKIYHHGPHDSGKSITQCRCAEVLLPSPFQISSTLQFIYCRSEAEREFLLHSLDAQAKTKWLSKIVVSHDMKVFQREYTYVEQVLLYSTGIKIKFSPRKDGQSVKAQVSVTSKDTGELLLDKKADNLKPNEKFKRIDFHFKPGIYLVEIQLEDCAAYSALKTIEEDIF